MYYRVVFARHGGRFTSPRSPGLPIRTEEPSAENGVYGTDGLGVSRPTITYQSGCKARSHFLNLTIRKYMGTKASEFNELVRGASVNQLAQLFDLDRRTVANRLKDVQPCGKRNSFPIYKISEVAELLVVGYMTGDQVTETQKRQRADKEKDYWDAKLKEQKYLENMGDLWRTERIVEVFATVFKQIRESVTVFIDALEHESGLPAKQIDKAKHFGDALLVEMRDRLMSLELDPEGEHVLPEPVVEARKESDEVSDAELEELGLL